MTLLSEHQDCRFYIWRELQTFVLSSLEEIGRVVIPYSGTGFAYLWSQKFRQEKYLSLLSIRVSKLLKPRHPKYENCFLWGDCCPPHKTKIRTCHSPHPSCAYCRESKTRPGGSPQSRCLWILFVAAATCLALIQACSAEEDWFYPSHWRSFDKCLMWDHPTQSRSQQKSEWGRSIHKSCFFPWWYVWYLGWYCCRLHPVYRRKWPKSRTCTLSTG